MSYAIAIAIIIAWLVYLTDRMNDLDEEVEIDTYSTYVTIEEIEKIKEYLKNREEFNEDNDEL